METANDGATVMVYLEPELKRKFKLLCCATGKSMSGLLASVIADLVARHVPNEQGQGGR